MIAAWLGTCQSHDQESVSRKAPAKDDILCERKPFATSRPSSSAQQTRKPTPLQKLLPKPMSVNHLRSSIKRELQTPPKATMRNRIIRFVNAYLVKPDGTTTVQTGTLEVDGPSGTICWIDAGEETRAFDPLPDGPPRRPAPEGQCLEIIDVQGNLLSPGLIDVCVEQIGDIRPTARHRSGITSRIPRAAIDAGSISCLYFAGHLSQHLRESSEREPGSSQCIATVGTCTAATDSSCEPQGVGPTLDQCIRDLATLTGIPLSQAIAFATMQAAHAIGGQMRALKGCLRPGMDADLVIWNISTGQVMRTMVAGQTVYKA